MARIQDSAVTIWGSENFFFPTVPNSAELPSYKKLHWVLIHRFQSRSRTLCFLESFQKMEFLADSDSFHFAARAPLMCSDLPCFRSTQEGVKVSLAQRWGQCSGHCRPKVQCRFALIFWSRQVIPNFLRIFPIFSSGIPRNNVKTATAFSSFLTCLINLSFRCGFRASRWNHGDPTLSRSLPSFPKSLHAWSYHYTQNDYRTELYYFQIIFCNSCSVITEPNCLWNYMVSVRSVSRGLSNPLSNCSGNCIW